MITLIQEKDRIIIEEFKQLLIVFIPSKIKGHYICDCPDNPVSKGIIKLVMEYGKLGTDFIKIIYSKYGQSITVKMIMGDLASITNNNAPDTLRFRELLAKAEKYKVVIKYNTSWRLPKDNVKYLYNYLESIEALNIKT